MSSRRRLEIYSSYRRKIFVGLNPAPLAVDLYDLPSRGRAPAGGLARRIPAAASNTPTRQLSLPGSCSRPPEALGFRLLFIVQRQSRPSLVTATKRNKPPLYLADFAIRAEFRPQPQDVVIMKQRASVFFGTPLTAHLTQRN